MAEPVIRPLVREDAPTIAMLCAELAAMQGIASPVPAERLPELACWIADGTVRGFLAEVDGAAVGYLTFLRNRLVWGVQDYFWIDDIYVRGDQRGLGLGERMMAAVARVALAENVFLRWGMQPDNQQAGAFYRRLGAQPHEKTLFTWRQPAMGEFLRD